MLRKSVRQLRSAARSVVRGSFGENENGSEKCGEGHEKVLERVGEILGE